MKDDQHVQLKSEQVFMAPVATFDLVPSCEGQPTWTIPLSFTSRGLNIFVLLSSEP